MYEQRENDAGYIYYVNKKTGEKQNDSPQVVEFVRLIRDESYRTIKYAAYRCASKLWTVKQTFCSKFMRTGSEMNRKLMCIFSDSREYSVLFRDIRAEPLRAQPVRQCACTEGIAANRIVARHLFCGRKMWTFLAEQGF